MRKQLHTQNAIQVECDETESHIFARCSIDRNQFENLLASVAPDTMLLVAVPPAPESDTCFRPLVVAVNLPSRIDPSRSRAEMADNCVLLTLEKRAGAEPKAEVA